MFSRAKLGIFLVSSMFLLTACVHTVMPEVTPLTYVPDKMKLVGFAEGESTTYVFLGIFGSMGDGYSTDQAEYSALAKVHGDAILNPVVDVDTQNYFNIYEVKTLRISGLAVSFKDAPRPQGSGQDTNVSPASTPNSLPIGNPPPM